MASPLRCSSLDPLLLVLLSAVALLAVSDSAPARLGGLTPIRNAATNHEVQDVGRFAVAEYNCRRDKNSKPLTFSAVTSGRQQVVAGVQYFLKVATSVGGVRRVFIAVVYVKLDNSRELVSFKPLQS